jgi:hypothetical protein
MPNSAAATLNHSPISSSAVGERDESGTSGVDHPSAEGVGTVPWIDRPSSNAERMNTANTLPERHMLIPDVAPSSRVKVLQRWEGTVESIDHTDFTAVLRDLSNLTNPREQVRFSKEDVSEDDVPLLKPGAVFYWFIGRAISEYGQVETVSRIRFRRLPLWTARRLERAASRAQRFATILLSGESDSKASGI